MNIPQVVRIAAAVGCPIKDRDLSNGLAWDGKTIALRENGKVRPLTNLVHDIAHYLVCGSKTRRRTAEFGLGSAPEISARPVSSQLRWGTAQEEEQRASLLGIAIERAMGMPWKKTVREHGWSDDFPDVVAALGTKTGSWLVKNGFLDNEFRPVCLGLIQQ